MSRNRADVRTPLVIQDVQRQLLGKNLRTINGPSANQLHALGVRNKTTISAMVIDSCSTGFRKDNRPVPQVDRSSKRKVDEDEDDNDEEDDLNIDEEEMDKLDAEMDMFLADPESKKDQVGEEDIDDELSILDMELDMYELEESAEAERKTTATKKNAPLPTPLNGGAAAKRDDPGHCSDVDRELRTLVLNIHKSDNDTLERDGIEISSAARHPGYEKTTGRITNGVKKRRVRSHSVGPEEIKQTLDKHLAEDESFGIRASGVLGPDHLRRGVHDLPNSSLGAVARVCHEQPATTKTRTNDTSGMSIQKALEVTKRKQAHRDRLNRMVRENGAKRAAADSSSQDQEETTPIAKPPTKDVDAEQQTFVGREYETRHGVQFLSTTNSVGFIEQVGFMQSVNLQDVRSENGSLVVLNLAGHADGSSPAGYNIPLANQVAYQRTYATDSETNASNLHVMQSKLAPYRAPKEAPNGEPLDFHTLQAYTAATHAYIQPRSGSFVVAGLSSAPQGPLPKEATVIADEKKEYCVAISLSVEQLYFREARVDLGQRPCCFAEACYGLKLNIPDPFILREADYLYKAMRARKNRITEASLSELESFGWGLFEDRPGQPCVICLHIRACVVHHEVVANNSPLVDSYHDAKGEIKTNASILIAPFFNLVDQDQEYARKYCCNPLSNIWTGLAGPIMYFDIDSFDDYTCNKGGRPVRALQLKKPPTNMNEEGAFDATKETLDRIKDDFGRRKADQRLENGHKRSGTTRVNTKHDAFTAVPNGLQHLPHANPCKGVRFSDNKLECQIDGNDPIRFYDATYHREGVPVMLISPRSAPGPYMHDPDLYFRRDPRSVLPIQLVEAAEAKLAKQNAEQAQKETQKAPAGKAKSKNKSAKKPTACSKPLPQFVPEKIAPFPDDPERQPHVYVRRYFENVKRRKLPTWFIAPFHELVDDIQHQRGETHRLYRGVEHFYVWHKKPLQEHEQLTHQIYCALVNRINFAEELLLAHRAAKEGCQTKLPLDLLPEYVRRYLTAMQESHFFLTFFMKSVERYSDAELLVALGDMVLEDLFGTSDLPPDAIPENLSAAQRSWYVSAHTCSKRTWDHVNEVHQSMKDLFGFTTDQLPKQQKRTRLIDLFMPSYKLVFHYGELPDLLILLHYIGLFSTPTLNDLPYERSPDLAHLIDLFKKVGPQPMKLRDMAEKYYQKAMASLLVYECTYRMTFAWIGGYYLHAEPTSFETRHDLYRFLAYAPPTRPEFCSWLRAHQSYDPVSRKWREILNDKIVLCIIKEYVIAMVGRAPWLDKFLTKCIVGYTTICDKLFGGSNDARRAMTDCRFGSELYFERYQTMVDSYVMSEIDKEIRSVLDQVKVSSKNQDNTLTEVGQMTALNSTRPQIAKRRPQFRTSNTPYIPPQRRQRPSACSVSSVESISDSPAAYHDVLEPKDESPKSKSLARLRQQSLRSCVRVCMRFFVDHIFGSICTSPCRIEDDNGFLINNEWYACDGNQRYTARKIIENVRDGVPEWSPETSSFALTVNDAVIRRCMDAAVDKVPEAEAIQLHDHLLSWKLRRAFTKELMSLLVSPGSAVSDALASGRMQVDELVTVYWGDYEELNPNGLVSDHRHVFYPLHAISLMHGGKRCNCIHCHPLLTNRKTDKELYWEYQNQQGSGQLGMLFMHPLLLDVIEMQQDRKYHDVLPYMFRVPSTTFINNVVHQMAIAERANIDNPVLIETAARLTESELRFIAAMANRMDKWKKHGFDWIISVLKLNRHPVDCLFNARLMYDTMTYVVDVSSCVRDMILTYPREFLLLKQFFSELYRPQSVSIYSLPMQWSRRQAATAHKRFNLVGYGELLPPKLFEVFFCIEHGTMKRRIARDDPIAGRTIGTTIDAVTDPITGDVYCSMVCKKNNARAKGDIHEMRKRGERVVQTRVTGLVYEGTLRAEDKLPKPMRMPGSSAVVGVQDVTVPEVPATLDVVDDAMLIYPVPEEEESERDQHNSTAFFANVNEVDVNSDNEEESKETNKKRKAPTKSAPRKRRKSDSTEANEKTDQRSTATCEPVQNCVVSLTDPMEIDVRGTANNTIMDEVMTITICPKKKKGRGKSEWSQADSKKQKHADEAKKQADNNPNGTSKKQHRNKMHVKELHNVNCCKPLDRVNLFGKIMRSYDKLYMLCPECLLLMEFGPTSFGILGTPTCNSCIKKLESQMPSNISKHIGARCYRCSEMGALHDCADVMRYIVFDDTGYYTYGNRPIYLCSKHDMPFIGDNTANMTLSAVHKLLFKQDKYMKTRNMEVDNRPDFRSVTDTRKHAWRKPPTRTVRGTSTLGLL